jgi:hypothetical protein
MDNQENLRRRKPACRQTGLKSPIYNLQLVRQLIIHQSSFIIHFLIPYYETPSAHHHPVRGVQLIYLHRLLVRHLQEP